MKKILFIFLFIINFSYSSNYYYDNYNNYIEVQAIDDLIDVCSVGKGLKFVGTTYVNLNLYADDNKYISNMNVSNSLKFKAKSTKYPNLFYSINVQKQFVVYECGSEPCIEPLSYVGTIDHFVCSTEAASCSDLEYYAPQADSSFKCKLFEPCSANQTISTNSFSENYNQCFDVCHSLDTYECFDSSLHDVVASTGISNFEECCTTPDNTTKEQCEQATSGSYAWICNANSSITKFVDMVLGTHVSGHCACHDMDKSIFAMEMIDLASNFIPQKRIPNIFRSLAKNKDEVTSSFLEVVKPKTQNDSVTADAFFDYISQHYDELVATYGTAFKDRYPRDMLLDFTDVDIVTSADGLLSFKPEFTTSPNSTSDGKVHITSDGITNNFKESGVDPNLIDSALPPKGYSVTGDVYVSAVQTATRTQFTIPSVHEVGEVVTITAPVPKNVTVTESTIHEYRGVVEQLTANSFTIRTEPTAGGSVRQIGVVRHNDGSETYHVTTTDTVKGFDGTPVTHTLTYDYTKRPDGSIIHESDPTSTTSGTKGGEDFTYTNPISSDPLSPDVDYNYNSIKQNIDEMLNYKPTKLPNDIDAAMAQDSLINNDIFSFLGQVKDNLTNLLQNFNDTLALLQNKPTLNQHTGSCMVRLSIWNRVFENDFCAVVAPAKPLIAFFLTFFGTISVIMFAIGGKNND